MVSRSRSSQQVEDINEVIKLFKLNPFSVQTYRNKSMKYSCYIHLPPTGPHEDIKADCIHPTHLPLGKANCEKQRVTTLLAADTQLLQITNSSACKALPCLFINIKQLFMRAYTCNPLLCPTLLGFPAASLLEICPFKGISVHITLCTDSYHGRSMANVENHPENILVSVTRIADSQAGQEQRELLTSFPTLMLFHSLAGTGRAHRHCAVWTLVQTNPTPHFPKIQRTPSASSELAD